MKDFVRDENGDVSLVIISRGGLLGIGSKNVAFPFTAFSFNEDQDHVLLDVEKDRLANAPEIEADERLTDRAFAEELYRHFGERPYWTDKGDSADEPMKSDEEVRTREYYGKDDGINEEF